jgi:phosphoribosylformimino-5-aminoimidazole carboxamide ribotide isomerase
MLLVIPALEIHNGECSYCIKGERGTEKMYAEYSHHPEDLCRLLRRENAKSLHITDYDSINKNSKSNFESIIRFAKTVDIPFQVLYRFDDIDECRDMLNSGIYRIIIDDFVWSNPDDIQTLIHEFTSSRIACFMDSNDGYISFGQSEEQMKDLDFTDYLKTLGVNRVVYRDRNLYDRVGSYGFDYLQQFAVSSGMRVTLFEGVAGSSQLWELQKMVKYGIDSVVIGKAMYDNKFPCQKIWRLIEADLEPEIK